jgi:hypothetical protein
MQYTLTSNTLAANAQQVIRSDGAYIPPDPGNMDFQTYLAWLAAGGTPMPCTAQAPEPTCLLWQLEASCNAPPSSLGFTPPTWAEIGTVIASMANAAITAFFNVGTNRIPASSATLLSIAAKTTPALTATQVAALVAAAATVVIP